MNNFKSIKQLWQHIAPYRRNQLALLLIVIVLASFAEVVSIGAVLPFLGVLMSPVDVFVHPLTMPVVQFFEIREARELLFPLTAIFVLAALISGAMRLILLWMQTRLGFAIGADFSVQIYRRTLYQPYFVQVQRNSSELIAAITTKTNSVIFGTLLPLFFIVSSALILTSILITLFIVNPIVALAASSGFATMYGVIIILTRKRLSFDSWRVSRESGRVIKALQEGLGGIRDVLIDGTQETYCKVYRDADLSLRKSQANIQIFSGAPRYLMESLGMVLIAVLAFWLARNDDGLVSAIPVLGVLAVGAQRLLPVLQQLYSNWTQVRGGQASLGDVLDLLGQPLMPLPKDISLITFMRSIRLKGVGFGYAEGGIKVLQGVNLLISKGSRVGIIGKTGSGKSTLVDIVMSLLEPTEGTVEIDGVVLNEQNYRSWQAHLAHVPQNIFLADSSIAENIAFGIPPDEIDFERVRKAAIKAQIAATIESWNDKYDTHVGERGVRLSGGQRQRIGIARAFYKMSDVIILDEATSALDNDTERVIMDAIDHIDEEITILVVAHRLTTLKNCDCIFELEDGRIKRCGTYSEIIGGAYLH